MDAHFACVIVSAVFAILILYFIGLLGIYSENKHADTVQAKPVTTEIPEYTMKCTVFEDTCKEYTIYRITRN